MRRTENGWVDPCPICGEEILYYGGRRYWPEGFPYIHECPRQPLTIPNEQDFQETRTKSPDFKPQKLNLQRLTDKMLNDYIALTKRDPSREKEHQQAMAEARRRLKQLPEVQRVAKDQGLPL